MIVVSFAELLFVYFAFVVIKRRLGDNCAIIAVNTRDVMSFSLIHDSSTQDFNAIKVGIVKIQLKKNVNLESFSLIMLYGNTNQLGAKLKAISLILLIFLRLFTTSFI